MSLPGIILNSLPTINEIEGKIVSSSVEYCIEFQCNSSKWNVTLTKNGLRNVWNCTQKEIAKHPDGAATVHAIGNVLKADNNASITTEMIAVVKSFLQLAAQTPQLLSSPCLLKTFEMSAASFDENGNRTSIKEGFCSVRSWLCQSPNMGKKREIVLGKRRRWVVIKTSYIALYDSPVIPKPVGVFLFDSNTHLKTRSGCFSSSTSIVIENNTLELSMEPEDKDFNLWTNTIQRVVKDSEYSILHRDGSFAPVRLHSAGALAKWFVDAHDTYEAMYYAISEAKHEILITDWWLSPEVQLLRPVQSHPEAKLTNLLKQKAEEGLMIYVLIYKDVDVALHLNSEYSARTLSALHRNISVVRDPEIIIKNMALWSHHEKLIILDQRRAFIGGFDLCFGRYDTHQHILLDETEPYVFPGKDFYNERLEPIDHVNNPDVSQLNRAVATRLPWHDVHCCVDGQAARDLAYHFVQRWNYAVMVHKLQKKKGISLLVQKTGISHSEREQDQHHIFSNSFPCDCQILRSASHWSAGNPTEKSIQQTYLRMINESKHFIYIENQFFISGLEDDTELHNRIADALVKRILRAKEEKQKFRVLIFIPLFPSYPGRPDEHDAKSLRAIMRWQYRTICRGENSMYGRLFKDIEDPFQYLLFCGLRCYATRKDSSLVSELIYIHSKTMIVDDRWTIIGSANINERSMNGDRDSETAVVMEDKDFITKKMNGQECSVGRFSHSFRMKLYEEHFGLLPGTEQYAAFEDPAIDTTWNEMQKILATNTSIYENVFGCIPNDHVLTFDDLKISPDELRARQLETTSDGLTTPILAEEVLSTKEQHNKISSELDEELKTRRLKLQENTSNLNDPKLSLERKDQLENLRGHAVRFPLKFLLMEELESGVEGLIPNITN